LNEGAKGAYSAQVEAGKQKQRFLSLWVLALWGTGLAIGLFGILQVARVKDEVRGLAHELLELSSKFSALEAQESRILDSARRLIAAAQDSSISEQEGAELKTLSPQAAAALLQLENLISEVDRRVKRLSASSSSKESDSITQALLHVLAEARLHREQAQKLLPLLSEPSLALESMEEVTSIISVLENGLAHMDGEVAKILLLFVAESVERAEIYERRVFVELALATLFGLILGGFIIYRIRVMQNHLIAAEQLGVLAKLAISLQHEINNPLSVIVGNAYLLRSSELKDPERIAALQAVESSAKSIAEVLKRTKDMERLVTTEYVGGLEMVDLSSRKQSVNSK